MQSDPATEAMNEGAQAAIRQDWNSAINRFSEAIRLNPKLAAAYNDRGLSYYMKGDWDKAIKDLSEAINLNPKDEKAYYNRARAYASKGDNDKAITDFSEAIRTQSGICQGILEPRRVLREQGRLRQGDCRLYGGHPSGSETCRGVL